MTIALILLLSPTQALTTSQGTSLEKDINFRSKAIHRQVEQAIQGKLVNPSESKVNFNAEPFKVHLIMKF